MTRTWPVVITYLVAITTANLTVAWWGPWWSVVNAALLIGFDLTARDRLHAAWDGRGLVPRMAALIAAGGGLAWLVNADAGRIAVASTVAFVVAASADAITYHYTRSVTRSNLVGAAVDSVLFPAIAFGPLAVLGWVMVAQFAAKVLGGEVWRRVLPRSEVRQPTT